MHPAGFDRVGDASDRQGTTPGNAIDGQPGECGTGTSFWAFASSNGAGADFWLQANNSIRTLSVSIQSCSTGDKEFVIKRSDGNYQRVYSLGPSGGNTFGTGSVEGNFIQPDGRIIIGVRNTRAESVHYLNDISLDFSYAPANEPPSTPNVLTPSENETLDATATVSWNESTDAENNPVTYRLSYSTDGTSWEPVEDNVPCCSFQWNLALLQEGGYFISVEAFDGNSYSGRSVRGINVKHVFFENAFQGRVILEEPVEWTVKAYGSGNRDCTYALPTRSFNGSVYLGSENVPSQKNGEEISWDCDFSLGNYTIGYLTPAIKLAESGWLQDAGFHSTLSLQKLVENQVLRNEFNEAYSGVRGAYSCPPGFSCTPASFEFSAFEPGEANTPITAEGDGITQTESVRANGYYNKTVTIESALPPLANVSGEVSLPDGLEFTLFVETAEGLTDAGEKGIGFSFDGRNAQVAFSNLANGTTTLLFSAKLKETGEPCSSGDECVTGYCSEVCAISSTPGDSNNSFEAIPSATPFVQEQRDLNATHYAPSAGNAAEIIIPDRVEVGWQNVSFMLAGKPGWGKAAFYGPDGTKFEVAVENGSASFFFDKVGFWRISFEGKTKETYVYKKVEAKTSKPQAITGEALSALSPLHFLAIAAGALLFLAFKRFKHKSISISGEWKDGRFELKVKNELGSLHDAVLTQMVDEGSSESHSPEAKKTETVTGDLLEWDLGDVPSGTEVSISYACAEKAGRKPAMLKALTENGKSVCIKQL